MEGKRADVGNFPTPTIPPHPLHCRACYFQEFPNPWDIIFGGLVELPRGVGEWGVVLLGQSTQATSQCEHEHFYKNKNNCCSQLLTYVFI